MARRRKRKPKETLKPHRRVVRKPGFNLTWFKAPAPNIIRQSGVGVAWLSVIAGVIAAWVLGVPRLQAFAIQQRKIDPHKITIRFVDPPPMSRELADSLLRTATMQVGSNPLANNDLVAIRHALLETGWFDSINQVRRLQDDLIEIDANFVRPHTVVRDSDGDHIVDSNGKLLPMSFETGTKLKFHPIAITGAHFPRPQRAGMQWEGADVAAGMRLIQLLDRQPWHSQINEIDVSGYLNDQPIKLQTDKGCTIVWGGPPGEEPALEVLATGKLERLDFFFQRYGRIDRNITGELDITGEKAVVSR